MELIHGIETIRNLVGEPPQQIPIDRETMTEQQVLMPDWNHMYIAIIPYCFKCKEPLTWHTPPEDDILFDCPRCHRIWVKDSTWPNSKRAIEALETEARMKEAGVCQPPKDPII